MNTTEHRIYHVARKCAGHNFELDDRVYGTPLSKEKVDMPEKKLPTLEEADAYVFHKFHTRQFEYAEKLSCQLCSKAAEEINLIIPKALRQFNVLLAAREDLLVTKVRFENYLENFYKEE